MGYSVSAFITPEAAARLILSGDIDLSADIPIDVAKNILNKLLELPLDSVLRIVDCQHYGKVAEIKHIPQFSIIETLSKVPSFFYETGKNNADYAQLGFFLKKDINAKLGANVKFGETYGKGAALLGIVNCTDKRIVPSFLSSAFYMFSEQEQKDIIVRLFFRIPIVQIILCLAKDSKVDGYDPMEQLSESTKYRRGQCLRSVFKMLRDYDNESLNKRLDNIVWENCEVG